MTLESERALCVAQDKRESHKGRKRKKTKKSKHIQQEEKVVVAGVDTSAWSRDQSPHEGERSGFGRLWV